ncbi:ankyrin repeat domain-containing protein [Amycolatopsis sp. H20-H5]|uniref:ankyrin repeat domain-containing protein n=1 Tax=Amycolatopsis sp. H20-H5 TaxID=3046309 RepID=UPI002DB56DDC|nr:ankyrin repeat domain-containing protein [Amycolatopsis sp. H20-H5]MEC3973792.1 ankyrin repeat domain-containing protein [Amycolatopsis sp. H20-H5]
MSALPPKPSLEQLRKRAKELAKAGPVKLSEAQFALARQYGFPSWPKLQAYVRRAEQHGPGLQHAYHADIEYYTDRALGLLASAEDGTPDALAFFGDLPLSRTGARAAVAREHGFADWRALRAHVGTLDESGEPFARAYQRVEARDVEGLAALVDAFPDLVHAKGTNGNDLLGMAGATCDERLSRVLLDRGADPAAANAHGWTPLHQAAYNNLPLLAGMLLDAGAPTGLSARGDGGTPLVVALFWGNRTVAELLAGHGDAPANLRVAAGLGDRDLLDELLSPTGELAPAAGAHRAYYRPHSGFPAWLPADDPAEIRDEALAWAARNGRTEAIRALVARGASIDADVYRGTALTWAAANDLPHTIRTLLELGADVNRRGTFGGPDHGNGITALHLAAQGGKLDAIRTLLEAGADPTIRDTSHGGTPQSWAAHGGEAEAEALLRDSAE